ncbi:MULTISPECIES: stage IV sporulation intramembrane metalloprotease SpoIVFB [Bacillus]|uniref:stage IV sporulation intramembrane metalloprotease SpoIVFB n=1 Tax=Bacillus TaxID=1386 RepID=UPI00032DB841|nr:stage IV sporulation intramembrane metalloprotease SpoIVFB [Bacillus wiedmannii]EOP13505.1 stage IV sporulation protein FB [Bacillus cereus BAG2O-3]EOQ08997.1 stage IV sporulation protein FB [Bacillus cereus B5-2]EOQ26056.1 stage IV sporulation protein FB [Bacillus cereus BAG3O-1]MBJ8119083.1 stage IV sporulation intramembrane metalloprotease SpoIVFB [Bacillus cereus]PFW53567.1 stage IV sporulation protein FB [Bacillus sp. AFS075960]RFB10678.1 stage IV sporulation protein FB [Bacillus sp. 
MIKYRDVLTKISVHPLFWVIIVIGIFTARFKELLLLFCIVLIHELGHAFAAAHYNWRIKKIQLLPFGGVAELEEHGNKSLKEELVVVIAGPIQHIWMMLVGYILFEVGWLDADLYYFFMWNNIIILAFNLLPIWPLDGGKVLFNVLSYRFPYLQAHEKMMKLSCVFFSVILGWQLLWNSNNVMMWVLLIFLAVSLYQEWKQRRYAFMRFLLERYYGNKRGIEKIAPIEVQSKDHLYKIFTKFRRGYKHSIIVHGKYKEHYTLDENELLYAYFTEKRTTSSVEELIG